MDTLDKILKDNQKIVMYSPKYSWRNSLYSTISFLRKTEQVVFAHSETLSPASFVLESLGSIRSAAHNALIKTEKSYISNKRKGLSLASLLHLFARNDRRVARYLLKKQYITNAPIIQTKLSAFGYETSVISAMGGHGVLRVASDLMGRPEYPQKVKDDEAGYSRLFSLFHEMGHTQNERLTEKFAPSPEALHFLPSSDQHSGKRMVDVLNTWLFQKNFGASFRYLQIHEAYADAFATLVLLKEIPESRPFLQKVKQSRQKDRDKRFSSPLYDACCLSIDEALQANIDLFQPQDIVFKAREIASNAWLKTISGLNGQKKSLFSKVLNEMKSLPHFLSGNTMPSITMEYVLSGDTGLEKMRERANGHPAQKSILSFLDKAQKKLERFSQEDLNFIDQSLTNADFEKFGDRINFLMPAPKTEPRLVQQRWGGLFDAQEKEAYDDDMAFFEQQVVINQNQELEPAASKISLSHFKNKLLEKRAKEKKPQKSSTLSAS